VLGGCADWVEGGSACRVSACADKEVAVTGRMATRAMHPSRTVPPCSMTRSSADSMTPTITGSHRDARQAAGSKHS